MKHKPDFIDREIGRRLRVARIAANIRQYRAANLVGVTYQQMRKYEVGCNRVSAVIVARLAQIYQRPVAWFLEDVRVGEEAKAGPLTAGSIGHQYASEARSSDPTLARSGPSDPSFGKVGTEASSLDRMHGPNARRVVLGNR